MINAIIKKNYFKDFILIFIGSIISSIGINMFLVKANLLSGGVTGVSLILQYTANISSGVTIILLNIPLFLLSYMKLTKRFTIYSIWGVATLSTFMMFTNFLSSLPSTDDILLLCLYGGIFSGIGLGLIFSRNGSTGGFDIIIMIIKKKYPNFEIGTISFFSNLLVISLSMALFGMEIGMYTLVSIFISSYIIDTMIKGMNKKKVIFIVTEKEKEISDSILSTLHRGATYLFGEGAYTKVHRNVIYCIVSPSELPELREIVLSIDKKAFINILDASEVHGKGFKYI